MPLFLGEHRVMGWWGVRIAVPFCLVAIAGSAASATRPLVAVSRAPLVAPRTAAIAVPTGQLELEPVTIRPDRHPLDGLSAAELHTLARTTPDTLGPAIVGRPNRGRLWNALRLESGPGLEVMNEERNYATHATVSSLLAAVAEVEREFPGSVLRVGDLSGRRGGYIRPHRSHQAGVDADIGFYYRTPAKWYTKANATNLDRERTWALVKALVAQGTVEYLFVDRSIQVLLRDHALSIGEPREFLDALFETPAKRDTLIRHTWGHLTHFHVRFIDPVAEETGRRAGPSLEKAAWALKAKPSPKKR
jgi:penicillin-insensitive murein endopeptidase